MDNTENFAPEQSVDETIEQQVEEPQEEGQQNDDPNAEPNEEGQEGEDNVVFPKKAVNALSRRDKKIAKLNAELQELRQREAEWQRGQQSQHNQQQHGGQNNQAPQEPNLDDYDNFADYQKALTQFYIKQSQEALKQQSDPQQQAQQQQLTPQQVQQQVHYSQRAQHMDTIDADLSAKLPDYEQLKTEYSDVLADLPQHVAMAMLDAENGPLALYTLAREGKVEQLLTMNPTQAAAEMARAEIRGQQYLNKQPSSAPAPIKGVKGNSSKKSPDQMSDAEFDKWLNT